MTESETSRRSQLGPILDLLESTGYGDVNRVDLSDFDKLYRGLAWCIASIDCSHKIDTVGDIEAALRSMRCPHVLQATQIKHLEYAVIYPAVKWIVSLVKTRQGANSFENERKPAVLTQLQLLKGRINEAGADNAVQKLASLLKLSKGLERQGSEFESECSLYRLKVQSDITELEEKFSKGTDDDKDQIDYLNTSIYESSEKLKVAKKELANKSREWVLLKRQLEEVPIQAELVQYELRLSELNVHMQDRLHRTRKYYDTYNALLEIKDLMLKETSLLNSIEAQSREAIGNPASHMKLIDSLETILKGSGQKLEKVQLGLQVEQKTLDTLREQYIVAIANQRHCSLLLKAFQEECRKNERLKEEFAKIEKQRCQTSS